MLPSQKGEKIRPIEMLLKQAQKRPPGSKKLKTAHFFFSSLCAVTAKKAVSRPSPPLTTPPSRNKLGNKTRKFTQSISNSVLLKTYRSALDNRMLYQMNVAVKIKVTDEKVLRKETTSMPKEAEGSFSPRPATPRVFTDRSGDLIDSGVVSGVYGSPDGVNGSGGVSKDCGGVPKVGVPVDSDGAPGGPGQVPEIPLMPSDGSKVFIIYLITGLINGVLSGMVNEILLGYGSNVNRASEGEQLWSPDPPTPSAGELYSTIPATRMATDNQLLKFANLQVVWYTNAISPPLSTHLKEIWRKFQEISKVIFSDGMLNMSGETSQCC